MTAARYLGDGPPRPYRRIRLLAQTAPSPKKGPAIMTRGKYATRAARRHEDADVQTEIGTYRHHVARLTGQAAELRAQLDAERAARKDETRRLRAQLDEGLSPELTAVREELERQRQRAVKAEAAQREHREKDRRFYQTVIKLLMHGLGLTYTEAFEVMLLADPECNEPDGPYLLVADMISGVHTNGLTPDQAEDIQAARGKRHGRSAVVRLLKARLDEAMREAREHEAEAGQPS